MTKNLGVVKRRGKRALKKRTPHLKMRNKYETKVKNLVGLRAPMRDRSKKYDGEKTIKPKLVKSRKLF